MINKLKKTLAVTGYRCAQKEDGSLFLTRNTSDPGLTFLSPERFVENLQSNGQTINPKSLNITKLKKPAAKPVPKAKKEKPPKAKAELLAWDIVGKMKYNDLKSFAAENGIEFPGKVKKDKLLKLIKKNLY